MPILNRIRDFLRSPQGRRLTDEGIRTVRNRGTGRPAHGAGGGHGRSRGLLSSLLRRR